MVGFVGDPEGGGLMLGTRVWLAVAGAAGAVAGALTVLMVWTAATRPDWSVRTGGEHAWWEATPDNHALGLTTLVLWGLGMVALSLARGVRTFRSRDWMILQAILTLVLGLASYAPCRGQANLVSVPMWTLNLFTGQVENANIGPTSVICGGEYPLAFQVARLLGIATIALAGVTLLVNASRSRLDRLWAHHARDIDIVVGVNEQSVGLIEALVAQRREEPQVLPFYRETAREWLRRKFRPARRVVVIRANREDPLLAKVEALGARVYQGDPTDASVLKRVMLRHARRIAVHRLFAVTSSQARNASIIKASLDATAQARQADPEAWLSHEFVPRFVARFDDAREAQDFRLAHLDEAGCFVDAISSDELLAREIVARVREAATTTVAIIGDTPLTVALLDEFATRRAFARALEEHMAQQRRWPENHKHRSPGTLDNPIPQSVVLCAREAGRIRDEWLAIRAPSELVEPFELVAESGNWEDAVHRLGPGPSRLAVIITEETPQAESQALRVNRSQPPGMVFCRTADAAGVELPTPGRQAVVRFGATLLQSRGVPEDSWTVLAREAHRRYANPEAVRPGSREWGDPTDDPAAGLPDFYREDTLRQQRWVLQAITQRGFVWKPLRAGDPVPDLPDALIVDVARSEHERWCAWRTANGWSWGDARADRAVMDRERRNPNLVDWRTGLPLGAGVPRTPQRLPEELHMANAEDIRWYLERFREWGIVPVREYTRRGLVHAERLLDAKEWPTAQGSTLRSEAGDWWVENLPSAAAKQSTPIPNSGRGVAAAEFPRLYGPIEPAKGLYHRTGTVTAVQVTAPTQIRTLEGTAAAQPGSWVVTDDTGQAWPVPNAEFRSNYIEVLRDPSEAHTGQASR